MPINADDGRNLEQRLRLIEDRLEIYNLIASHPPSADTVPAITQPRSGPRTVCSTAAPNSRGRPAEWRLPADLRTPSTTGRSKQGIAHFAGLPYVRVTGDTAFAISYLQILVPDHVGPQFDVPNHGSSRGFHIHRVSANRWEFVRTEEGWKIKRRTLRPLDGSEPAREILRGALEP